MTSLRKLTARFTGRGPDARVALVTRSARGSLADRVRASADLLDPQPDTSGAIATLGLHASVTADARSVAPARATRSAVLRVRQAQRRRQHRIERLRARLAQERHAARLRAATEYDRAAAMLGHLSVWLSAVPVYALATAMTLNDPGFILMTLRTAFDVPRSRGLFDVTDADVVVALAAALAVTTVLLAGAHFVGKALGTVLFRPHLSRSHRTAGPDDGFPGIAHSERLMDTRSALVVACIGIVPIVWFMVLLHNFAVSRFEGDLAAAITGRGARTWVVWSITMLPLVVLAFQTVGSAPQLEHARRASSWSRLFRLREWRDVRVDQKHREREEQLRATAEERVADLADVLADIGKRTDAEAYAARISTGAVDVSQQAQAFRTPSERTCPGLDVTGSAAGRFLPGMDDVPNRVRIVVSEWTALEPEPSESQAVVLWREARAAAARTVRATGTAPAAGSPATGEDRAGPDGIGVTSGTGDDLTTPGPRHIDLVNGTQPAATPFGPAKGPQR